ncbi:hypothetical protein O3P69_001764 [Scylla paramamosain]|uniref:Uncharacterized protein n=1 Tax=Scylla paramamosain TaxID=85552 RepID=A0AAW0V1X1_SCYPA
MARWAKPEGWDYVLTACYSMKNHMKFLSTAVENILGEVRLVLANYVSSLSRIPEKERKALAFEEHTKVFENRPHSLALVRPPDPKSIASAAILQGEAVLILFLNDKKDKFTATLLKDDTAEENVPVLLTNVVESLPPNLLV